jgi:hypothetical protein
MIGYEVVLEFHFLALTRLGGFTMVRARLRTPTNKKYEVMHRFVKMSVSIGYLLSMDIDTTMYLDRQAGIYLQQPFSAPELLKRA